MYIEPNSTIKIYYGIPLDNTYRHTLYFTTKNAQNNYFHGGSNNIIKRTLSSQSYQRVVKGKMRVEVKADDLYDCNYLAFQNTSYGSKWFYAFINSVEYINNVTSEISFEIDVMQTYMFDITIKDCFVIREHSSTDNAGDNLVEEGLEIGDYNIVDFTPTGAFINWDVLVQSPYNENQAKTEVGSNYNGVINGNVLLTFKTQGAYLTWLRKMDSDGFTESIVTASMYPRRFCSYSDGSNVGKPSVSYINTDDITRPTKLGNYTPRNKKLLTYPYCYLGVTNGGTEIAEYHYEYFNDPSACRLTIYGDPNTITFMCVPEHYKGALHNWNEAISMSSIPLVSNNTDTYKIWYAQNKVTLTNNLIQNTNTSGVAIAGGAALLASGNPAGAIGIIGGVANEVNSVFGYMAQKRQHELLPNHSRGNSGCGIMMANAMQDFSHFNVHIREEFARMIDEYFDKYGYAVNRVKTPTYNARSHWNYIKTKGCLIIGKCPSDDIKKIESVFDEGITFWKNANEVGQYSTYANANKV